MIKIENVEMYGNKLKRTFSDEGFKIHKVGTEEIYDDAVDVLASTATYEETSEKIVVLTEREEIK